MLNLTLMSLRPPLQMIVRSTAVIVSVWVTSKLIGNFLVDQSTVKVVHHDNLAEIVLYITLNRIPF